MASTQSGGRFSRSQSTNRSRSWSSVRVAGASVTAMRQRYPPPVLRGLAVLMAVLAIAGAACGQHDSPAQKTAHDREKQAREVASKAGLSPAVQDFLALYATAANNKYSVTYGPSPAGTSVLLAQDP